MSAVPAGSLRAPIAVAINVMYEQWSADAAPGIGPMGNPLSHGRDYQGLSWAEYGPRSGIANLLDLFAETDVVATFYTSGVLAETRPASIEKIVEGGHAIQAHGWAQDLVPAGLTLDEEASTVERTVQRLAEVAGTGPSEWISPRCTPSASTPELIAAQGLRYFGDVFDDDEPYELATPAGDLIAIPFGMEINDLPLTIRYGRPIGDLEHFYRAAVEARRSSPRALVDVTVHAHIGGRPNGLSALRAIIGLAQNDDQTTITTRIAAAERTFAGIS